MQQFAFRAFGLGDEVSYSKYSNNGPAVGKSKLSLGLAIIKLG